MFAVETELKKSFCRPCYFMVMGAKSKSGKSLVQGQQNSELIKSTRNDHACQQIAKKLAALQIYQTGDQCRERIKWSRLSMEKPGTRIAYQATCHNRARFMRILTGCWALCQPESQWWCMMTWSAGMALCWPQNPAWALMGASSRCRLRTVKSFFCCNRCHWRLCSRSSSSISWGCIHRSC